MKKSLENPLLVSTEVNGRVPENQILGNYSATIKNYFMYGRSD